MGYLWPPRFRRRSVDETPVVVAEIEDGKFCNRCERDAWMGRLLNVGNDQLVCVDCFAFVTGIDDRDPIDDPTARSGDPRYVASTDRDLVSTAVAESPPLTKSADPRLERGKSERPLLAPLPPDAPRLARLLHWLGVRGVTIR